MLAALSLFADLASRIMERQLAQLVERLIHEGVIGSSPILFLLEPERRLLYFYLERRTRNET